MNSNDLRLGYSDRIDHTDRIDIVIMNLIYCKKTYLNNLRNQSTTTAIHFGDIPTVPESICATKIVIDH